MFSPDTKGKSGFTLIELLVVIAVIALLLSVMLPALQKAKKQAQRVVCGQHIRQIVQIELAYATDYKRLLPRFVNTAETQKGAHLDFDMQVAGVLPLVIEVAILSTALTQYGVNRV